MAVMQKTFTHYDRNGKPWRFVVNGTGIQADMLQRFLSGVRGIGGYESLRLSYYSDYEDNERFAAELERAVLSAVRDSGLITPEVEPPPTPTPEKGSRSVAAPASTPTAITDTDKDPEEYVPEYYWQKD